MGRNEEKRRVLLKLASCNLKSFAMRKVDFESLISNEKFDVHFACETFQRICRSGINPPLKFDGSVISMAEDKRRKRSRATT